MTLHAYGCVCLCICFYFKHSSMGSSMPPASLNSFEYKNMDSKGKEKEKDVIVDEKEMDMSSASDRVWLMKVPKYISSRWDKCSGNITAGQLDVMWVQGEMTPVKLILSEAVMRFQEKGEEPIPKEHGLIDSHSTSQTLGVFSQKTTPASANSPMETEKITFEGKVVQKLECRPAANESYMKLKRQCLAKAAKPSRTIKLIDLVQSFKPISKHQHNKEFEGKKKAEGKKVRYDKRKVMDRLFAAFEKHQYYSIKDLVKITNQPRTYLKGILQDICDYKLKNPHKNMWQLKPEYRHYKKDED